MKIGKDYIGVAVGAIILNDSGEILLTKRSRKSRNQIGTWETPGGSIDFGELRVDAIKREIKEELNIEIIILRELTTLDEILSDEKQHWIATTFVAKIKGKKQPKIMEPQYADAIGWFSLTNLPKPLSHITKLSLKQFRKEYNDLI